MWRALSRNPLVLFGALCLVIGCLVLIPRGDSYWNFSDGVYLYSSRQLLHAGGLYTSFAAAQPPLLYYAGAAILGLGDSIAVARICLFGVNLITAATVMVAVRRLTGRARLAAVAGALALLTPRALHDSAQLLPETFAAPLVMGAALLASRRRTVPLGAIAAALAVAFKLAYLLPAAAIAVAAVGTRRYAAWTTAALAAMAAASLLAFGSAMTDGVVDAQASLGFTHVSQIWPLLTQSVWNLLPFSLPVAAAWLLREQALDQRLLRTLAAAAAGSIAVMITIVKYGTFINLLVVAEPPLLALGVVGAAWAWSSRASFSARARRLAGAGIAVVALGGLQALSLVVSPGDPIVFARPLASSDGGWALSPFGVDAELERIASCPASAPYSGDPYLAFLADRRMPGDQGDTFIITSDAESRFLRAAETERPGCPDDPAPTHNSALLDPR